MKSTSGNRRMTPLRGTDEDGSTMAKHRSYVGGCNGSSSLIGSTGSTGIHATFLCYLSLISRGWHSWYLSKYNINRDLILEAKVFLASGNFFWPHMIFYFIVVTVEALDLIRTKHLPNS